MSWKIRAIASAAPPRQSGASEPDEFDREHKGRWLFSNGHYDFQSHRFRRVTEQHHYSTQPMVSKTSYAEPNPDRIKDLERYFAEIFPVAEDFEVFKNMIGCAVRCEASTKSGCWLFMTTATTASRRSCRC